MTTAWIDIRGCKSDQITDIISAAAEHRIEGVIFDGESDNTPATRQAGVQWVAFKNGGNGAGPESPRQYRPGIQRTITANPASCHAFPCATGPQRHCS